MDRFQDTPLGLRSVHGNGEMPVDSGIPTHDFGFTVPLTIEKNIPVPAQKRGRYQAHPSNPIEDALYSMQVGDSLKINESIAAQGRTALHSVRKRLKALNGIPNSYTGNASPPVFTQRQITRGRKAFRIWRVK